MHVGHKFFLSSLIFVVIKKRTKSVTFAQQCMYYVAKQPFGRIQFDISEQTFVSILFAQMSF